MDTSFAKPVNWHYETLPIETKRALDFLSGQDWLKESDWYLTKGTALALCVGNRKSYDLYFFIQSKNFNEKNLLSKFLDNKYWKTDIEERGTIYGELHGAKISFIAYPFFKAKYNYIWYNFVKVLNPLDIAVMKITAISQRGKKRDFFDLYWCANNLESLEDIIKKLPEQYPLIAHDFHHILKSMVYFEDAESDPEPEIYFEADWETVKKFFIKEIPEIMKKVVGLD